MAVNPVSGDLAYDNAFIDEKEGTPCVQFNRHSWPGGATSGYYKPHSMLFVENSPPQSGATRDAAFHTTMLRHRTGLPAKPRPLNSALKSVCSVTASAAVPV